VGCWWGDQAGEVVIELRRGGVFRGQTENILIGPRPREPGWGCEPTWREVAHYALGPKIHINLYFSLTDYLFVRSLESAGWVALRTTILIPCRALNPNSCCLKKKFTFRDIIA
jgi:hypothetical protein